MICHRYYNWNVVADCPQMKFASSRVTLFHKFLMQHSLLAAQWSAFALRPALVQQHGTRNLCSSEAERSYLYIRKCP